MRPLNVQMLKLFSARYDARGVETQKVRCKGFQKPGEVGCRGGDAAT